MNSSRNVTRLGWVSLLTDISSEMLYALNPLYLTLVLGAGMSVLGIVEGIAEGTASVLKGLSGWHSDRIRKRKIFIFWGYGLSALAKPLMALANGWLWILGARFIDRFGKGIRTTARDALIADSTPPEKRGWAFGLHRAMDTLGAFVGVGISLILLFILSGKAQESTFRTLYWIAFIPAVIGVLFIIPVREMAPKSPDVTKTISRKLPRFSKRYYKVLILFGIFSLANSSDAFLLMRAKNLGFSVILVVLVYLCYNASYAALSYPIGKLADRIPKEKLLGIGLIVYAAVYYGFGAVKIGWFIWPLFLCYGIYIALTDGVSKALISNLIGTEERGTALGLFYMITGLLFVFASIAAGLLWDKISPSAPFYFGAALSAIAGVGFLTLKPSDEN